MTSRIQEEAFNTVNEKKSFQMSNLTVRLLTAIVLIPVAMGGMYLGGSVMLILLSLITVIGLLEFYLLAHERPNQGSALIGVPTGVSVLLGCYAGSPEWVLGSLILGGAAAFVLESLRHPGEMRRTVLQMVTTLCGVVYISLPLGFVMVIRNLDEGFMWLLVMIAATWGTDTFAYFGGRKWGKRKLAPVLSPSKTVEGAVIGLVMGFLFALIFLALGDNISRASLVMIAVAPFFAEAGDLFESAIKRFFKVKDSHVNGLNIIPGHGGVLDRIDSLLAVSTFFYLFMLGTGLAG